MNRNPSLKTHFALRRVFFSGAMECKNDSESKHQVTTFQRNTCYHRHQARIQGWVRRPPLGRRDPRRRRGFLRLKGRKKGHWCSFNGCSTPFKHNMAMHISKSCKYVFAYIKNRSFPSHIRSSIPWRPPLAEILDPRLVISAAKLPST